MVRSKTVRRRNKHENESNPDPINFKSITEYKFFKSLEDRPILAEKGYNSTDLDALNLLTVFAAVGWTGIFQWNDPVYDELTKIFYANFACEYDTVSSRCRGIDISISLPTMASIISCNNEGERIYFDEWPPQMTNEEIENEIEFVFARKIAREDLPSAKAGEMPLVHKLIHHTLVYNVIPKGGHWDAVKPLEVYLIYRIMKGIKINLPYLIFRHMRHTITSKRDTSLVFGRLLTKIFQHFELALEKEKSSQYIRPIYDIINKGTLRRMGYEYRDGDWVLGEKTLQKHKKQKTDKSTGASTSSCPPSEPTHDIRLQWIEADMKAVRLQVNMVTTVLEVQRSVNDIHAFLAQQQQQQQQQYQQQSHPEDHTENIQLDDIIDALCTPPADVPAASEPPVSKSAAPEEH
jgi:hypothetical protein